MLRPTRRKLLEMTSASAVALTLGHPLCAQGRPPSNVAAHLTVSLLTTAPSLEVAPAGYFFEAEVLEPAEERSATRKYTDGYDSNFHKPFYLWTFSDAGRFETPAHLVEPHRRKDSATGPFVGKVFDQDGTHRVRVDVYYPDGRWGWAETQVQVRASNAAFAAAETIIVAPDGNFAGAPPHLPRNAMRSLEQAFDRFAQLGTAHARILLKRGAIHVRGADDSFSLNRQTPDCLIGAWGSGARPVVDLRAGGGPFLSVGAKWAGRTMILSDLAFRGSWDSTVELWRGGRLRQLLSFKADATLTLHNCRETGCAVSVDSRDPRNRSPQGAQIFFNAYAKTDFKDFMLLAPRTLTDISVTGCRVVQHSQALNGGENRGTTSYALYARNSHNFIRCSARRLYVACNDIFVRHGWAPFRVYDNHPLRLNRNNASGMRAVIARNHLEGMIMRQAGGAKGEVAPTNILIEQNYIVDNPTVTPTLAFRSGPVTLRNNIVLEHDTPKLPKSGRGFQEFIGLSTTGKGPSISNHPFFIHHNSFICLRQTIKEGPPRIVRNEGEYRHVEVSDNILWAPHLDRPRTDDGPLDIIRLGWDARYRGIRLGWARLENFELSRNIVPGDSITFPYWRDFLGHPLSAQDFAGQADRHAIRLVAKKKKTDFDALKGEIAVRFLSKAVEVVNQSGQIWRAGALLALHCDRGTTPMTMDERFAQPGGTLALYTPARDSGAAGNAQGALHSEVDFLGNPRPGSAQADAPPGRAARGALEPR